MFYALYAAGLNLLLILTPPSITQEKSTGGEEEPGTGLRNGRRRRSEGDGFSESRTALIDADPEARGGGVESR
jgi:hypothetical protein